MSSEKELNSEKLTQEVISESVENDGNTSAGEVKIEQNNTESTFNAEEYNILKDKVERLEGLLTKCRGTIVNNKEKVKRLSEDKEGIQQRFEKQLNLLKLQYEGEMDSKFGGLQEQVQGLTQAKDRLQIELNDVLNLKGEDLIQKLRSNHHKELTESEEKVKSLSAELGKIKEIKPSHNSIENFQKNDSLTTDTSTTTPTTTDTSTTATTPTTNSMESVKVDPEEHKKVMKMLEARSEELIGVMEERTSLRRELLSQRERFSVVLERYDSQMKVVQEELRLRMMPGPLETDMSGQVATLMKDAGADGASEGDIVRDSGGGVEGNEKGDGLSAKVLEKSGDGSKSKGKSKLEQAEGKVVKMLELLERCARKADDRAEECNRWNVRFVEQSEKHQKVVSEAGEVTKRLEKEVSEMTTKDKDLSEELEETRTENGDMLRAQRSEMGDLQKVVDRLVANEEFLKTQIGDIRTQCDTEVSRANDENEKAMEKLKQMFEENKRAVSELFEQLTESKQKSNEMVKELENELDYRFRQLDAARTYINCLNDSKAPPAEPKLEAIFSNMPNFIYVDDVAKGDANVAVDGNGDAEKKESENESGVKKESENGGEIKNESENENGVKKDKQNGGEVTKDNSNEKVTNASDKNNTNNTKPSKSSKK